MPSKFISLHSAVLQTSSLDFPVGRQLDAVSVAGGLQGCEHLPSELASGAPSISTEGCQRRLGGTAGPASGCGSLQQPRGTSPPSTPASLPLEGISSSSAPQDSCVPGGISQLSGLSFLVDKWIREYFRCHLFTWRSGAPSQAGLPLLSEKAGIWVTSRAAWKLSLGLRGTAVPIIFTAQRPEASGGYQQPAFYLAAGSWHLSAL